MASKSVKINLDLDSKDAQRAIKDLNKELSNTEESAEEVESAGKTMARAMQMAADDMIDEIEKTKRAVDALELALDDVDIDPQQVVGDLKKIGLTSEEIEADAKELAEALKRIDDVKVSADKAGFTDLNKVMGESETKGKASSVAIGGIGNSISELPGIGAMGPLAESFGQLAETALEGEANVSQLGKALGVMGGTAAAMWLVSKAMDSIAKTKAFNDEQIESFRDAVEETEDGLSGVNEMLRETEKITGRAGGIGPMFEGTKDITKDLIDAGVTYDEWIESVEKGGPALELVTGKLQTHRDALREEQRELIRNNQSSVGYEEAISRLDNAKEIATETSQNYAKATEENSQWDKWAAESTLESAEAMEEAEAAAEAQTEALEEQSEALQENIDALTEQLDAQLEAVDAGYALEKAQFALTDAVTEANEVFGAAEEGTREYREAQLKVIDAANNVARAELRKAEETAAASGKTLTATQRTDAMNSSLVSQASTLNGPARQALLDHIARVNNIPANKMTQIQAAIDRGDIATAESLLNNTSRPRTTAVRADNDRNALNQVENDLNYITRPRTVTVRTSGGSGSIRYMASGSPYAPGGPTVVGEEGPELVDMPMGAAVTPARKSAGLLRSGGGSGPTSVTYVTQNFPAGVRPSDVVDAQRKWSRRNGPS